MYTCSQKRGKGRDGEPQTTEIRHGDAYPRARHTTTSSLKTLSPLECDSTIHTHTDHPNFRRDLTDNLPLALICFTYLLPVSKRPRRALTGGVREAEGGDAGAGLHEEAVGVAVVAAVELQDLLTLGERSHQTEHAHARL